MIAYAGKDVEEGEHSSIAGGSANSYNLLEINMAVSQKIGNQPTSRPNNTNLGHIPKGCSIILQGYLLNYAHSSIICNNKNLKTI